MWRCGYNSPRVRSALTLVELLVVLAIMGLLVTSLVPSAHYLMAHAKQRDVEHRLQASWRLARAMALAANRPVLWTMRQQPDGLVVSIHVAEAEARRARRMVFNGWEVEVESGPAPLEAHVWQIVVAPHGLTDALDLRLSRQGETVRVRLPAVLEPPAVSADVLEERQ